jgi:hypothetical protein
MTKARCSTGEVLLSGKKMGPIDIGARQLLCQSDEREVLKCRLVATHGHLREIFAYGSVAVVPIDPNS